MASQAVAAICYRQPLRKPAVPVQCNAAIHDPITWPISGKSVLNAFGVVWEICSGLFSQSKRWSLSHSFWIKILRIFIHQANTVDNKR